MLIFSDKLPVRKTNSTLNEGDLRSNEHHLNRSENKAWQRIQACTGVEPLQYPSSCLEILICSISLSTHNLRLKAFNSIALHVHAYEKHLWFKFNHLIVYIELCYKITWGILYK